jgi:hypothetical protein
MAHSYVTFLRSRCRSPVVAPFSSVTALASVRRCASSLGCLLLAACSKEPAPASAPRDRLEPSVGDPYHCAETPRPLAAGDDTPFGYPADSLSTRISGTHHATLSWQNGPATYGPETGDSELSIEVTSTPSVEFIDRSLVARQGWVIPAGVTEESYGCLDRIQLHADVHVSTSGGALDEVTPAVFEAGPSGIVLGWLELPLTALVGSFSGSLPVPDDVRAPENPSLVLRFGVADAAVAGDLALDNGELHSLDGSTVARGAAAILAHFPSGTGCGPEYGGTSDTQLLRRTAMVNALAQLAAASPLDAVSDTGGAGTLLELGFKNKDDSVCRETDTPVESALLFPALVELSSADGSIAGTLAADVVSLPELGRVTASASSLSEDPTEMQDLPAAFGIQRSVGMQGYRAGSVEFQTGLAQSGAWGALRAYGLGNRACTDADAGAADAAACSGDERALLWGMSWGQAPSDP